jgi:hypothetical protein
MHKRYGLFVFIFIAATTLAACGGGGGGGGGAAPTPTPTPTPVVVPTALPIVAYTQSVASNDTGTYNEVFPGQANVWTLDQDFSLADGFDGQFNWALALTVGVTPFLADQVYSELTFTGPYMGTSDGVKVAAVSNGATVFPSILVIQPDVESVKTGSNAAFLNATSDSRLQQTLDLTAATGTITLSWREAVGLDPGAILGYDPSYRVVVRNTDGTLLKELLANPVETGPTDYSIVLTPYKGQTIVLSFEESSSTSPNYQAYAIIDSVSVKDGGSKEYVTNGGFENGMTGGWTTNTPVEAQNVTSGARNLEGLAVKRSFYTVPNKLWGRWVDVFENHTAAPITKTITYDTSLGSDGSGVIYYSPGSSNKALTSWDAQTGDRDVGLVTGNTTTINFVSYDPNTVTAFSEFVTVTYTITVSAGGSVALVNFVIMDGTDTGDTPTVDITKKATQIDTEAAAIWTNFWTDAQYQAGMTQAQIGAISNFSR